MLIRIKVLAPGVIIAVGLSGLGPATTVAKDSEPVVFDEITVTVRKREELLRDIPLSISTFGADFIADSGANGIFELAQFTPGLSYRQSYGRTIDRPAIRGQSIVLGENTVGLFVDGVFVQGSLSSTPLDNVERVEVIRGPQSALFGRATLAGAINYITRKPGNQWRAKIKATAAEHEEYEVRGFISGPLIDNVLAFDFGARHYEYGGEYDNIGPGGGTIGGEQTDGVYGSLSITPNSNFSALLRATYFEDDDGHPANWLEIQADELNCFLTVARGYYCGEVKASDSVAIDILSDPGGELRNTYGIERETLRTSLELDWELNDLFTITSISAYTAEEEHWLLDLGPQVNPVFFSTSITEIDTEWDYWSQEIRLASPDDQRLRWLAGLYYYDSEESDPTAVNVTEISNTALFGSLELDISDRLTGSLELRWAEDDIDVTGADGSLDDTFASFTPRITLRWAESDTANVYGSIALGTKPGGFNDDLLDDDVPQNERDRLAGFLSFDEEQAWNFEIGTKRALIANRVNIEAAFFYIMWEDQQLTSSQEFTNSDGDPDSIPLITNIGETDIWGFELAANWQLSDTVRADLAYGYADAEIQKACDAEYGQFFGADSGCNSLGVPGGGSLKGNTPPNAPEHTLSLSLSVERPIGGNLRGFARGDYLYESERFAQTFNLASTGDSSVINLRAGIGGEQWRLTGWVKNLTDDDTVNAVIRIVDFNTFFSRRGFQAHLPRGRQVGLTFEYDFDLD